MFSTIPLDLSQIDATNVDKELLRAAIIGEFDATNLYEQMVATTKNEAIRAQMLDIAREEKAHVGELQTLLLRLDQEQVEQLEHGKREVEEMTHK